MSTAFSRRFQLVVDQLAQGNKKQFAELTGKSASHVYKICRGLSRPSMTYLESLYEQFRVDLNWLLTGEQNDNSQPAGQVQNKELVYAPVFDVQASAGYGAFAGAEEITDYFAFDRAFLSGQLGVSGEKLAFVTISGDSMLPTLSDGDQVLVDMTKTTVFSEGLFLVQAEDGLVAKRLKKKGENAIQVTSDNPEYPNWEINSSNQEQHQVIGQIVWFARSV